ncbi:Histone deacetylase complex subunit SAP18-like protein [Drosera capensis]
MAMQRISGADTLFAGAGNMISGNLQHRPPKFPPPPLSKLEPVVREKDLLVIGSILNGNRSSDLISGRTGGSPVVKEVHPEARRREARLAFAIVYPNKTGCLVLQQVGMTYSNGSKRNMDETKTLSELDFQIGDYLDVAIL